MPKLFRMPLVTLGTHVAPQKVEHVTPERVRHWVQSFNKLKSAGNKIPIPWGHQLKAIPAGDKEAQKYALARWNAGFVERFEQNPDTGGLDFVGEVPPGWEVETENGQETGRLINPKDGTVVREVSPGIGNWRDGQGVVHRDVIMHAALCTLPVIPGQSGFSATLATDGYEILSTLSTSTGKAMKDDKPGKKGPPDKSDKPAADAPPADSPDASLDLDTDLPPIDDAAPIAASPVPAAMPAGNEAQDILALAAAVGLALPPDTTPQNLLVHLKVALTTIASMGWKLQAPQAAAPGPEQLSPDLGMQNGQAESMSPNTAFMSTDVGQLVTLSTDAAGYVNAWGERQKSKIAQEWDRLHEKGVVSDDTARQEKEHLTKCRLTVNPDTKEVTIPDATSRLELVRNVTKGRGGVLEALTTVQVRAVEPGAKAKQPNGVPASTLSTDVSGVAEANPARGDADNGYDLQSHIREMAMMSGNLQIKDLKA